MESTEEPWGQLVSTTEMDSEPVTISKSTFTIGRSPACDFCFNGNKLVSSTHCVLSRDDGGKTWLEDRSTNGTLLNLKNKVSKQKVELQHGDEIHVVYRKNNPETNIAFVFQDTEKLKQETSDSTLDYEPSETDVATSEPDPLPPQKNNAELDESLLHTPKDLKSTTDGADRKRKRIESNTDEVPSKRPNIAEESPSVSGKASGDASANVTGDEQAKAKPEGDSEKKEAETAKKSEAKTSAKDETMDEIEESLMCIICQEIFYKCISLQPCMHSFCAGCYSDWMPQSDECPSCRAKVVRINKNHLVNNLVESYLKANPGKQRPHEDIAEQESKNKITMDMLYPKEQLKRASDESFSSASSDHSASDANSDSNSDSSSDSDYHPQEGENIFRNVVFRPPASPPPPRIIIPGRVAPPSLAAPGFGMMRQPAKVVCRQCPEYTGPLPTGRDGANAKAAKLFKAPEQSTSTAATASGTTDSDGAGPTAGTSGASPGGAISLPDVKTLPTVPNYMCTPTQTHTLCQCCMQPFPDRTADRQRESLPTTNCPLCYRNFCHSYWGCYKGCNGCIGVFRDMNFGRTCLRSIVNDNVYESAILENYLGTKNMSVRDLLTICLRRMDGGAYYTADKQIGTTPLSADTAVCHNCGLRNLKELAYQYRRDIPKKELPLGVTSRPDCHWGKNCRTQRNKPNHAARFNHICEQTKMS